MGNYTLPLPLQAIKEGFDTNLPKARWVHISQFGFLSRVNVVLTPSFFVHTKAHMSDATGFLAPFHWLSSPSNVRTASLILPAFQYQFSLPEQRHHKDLETAVEYRTGSMSALFIILKGKERERKKPDMSVITWLN